VLDKREIIIKDACILFDLVDLNLLEDFFQLEVSAYTTPQVIGEITNETQWYEISKFINNAKLKIDTEGKYEVIAQIYDEHAGLSIADSSVLELAIRKNAIIYSSDGILRKISVKRAITVRGILWIIEELYKSGFLSKEIAIQKLKLYEKINQRAPIKEIKSLISKLKL
jgi:rRNA maturation endonuclease Nob1